MTQAAVSYQIKVLEDRIGSPLFVRLPRQVALTPPGGASRRRSPRPSRCCARLRRHGAATSTTCSSISVLPTIAAHWLVPRLGRFQIAHPQLRGAARRVARHGRLRAREFDLGIRSGLGDWPGLEAHFLLPSHFTPVCSPGLLEARDIGEPGRHPRSCRSSARTIPGGREWFEEAGVGAVDLSDRPDHSLGTQHFEGMAAMAGQGVALVNPFFFAAELASGRLVQLVRPRASRPTGATGSSTRRPGGARPRSRPSATGLCGGAARRRAQAARNEECRRGSTGRLGFGSVRHRRDAPSSCGRSAHRMRLDGLRDHRAPVRR